MSRLNVTLLALLALLLSLVVVNDSWGQPITNQVIYTWFIDHPQEDTYSPPAGQSNFVGEEWANGNIIFPPPNRPEWNLNELTERTYTLELPAGRQFTFTNQLIIQETEYNGGLDVGIGRIQALGQPGNVVTMTGVGENAWGGIVIETDPIGGNLIEYCGIFNTGNANMAAVFLNGNNRDANCIVRSCFISNSANNAGLSADFGTYSFASNTISACEWGVRCTNQMDAGFATAIVNNIVNNCEIGIEVEGDWQGHITNNVINLVDLGISVVGINEDIVIRNNTISDCDVGISTNVRPSIFNNIILADNLAVIYDVDDPEEDLELDFCIFNIGAIDLMEDQNIVVGQNSIEADPEFINLNDHRLMWISPAINTGWNGDEDEFLDPDESDNDIGAFGGPRASEFHMFNAYIADYCLIADEEWNVNVTLIRDTYRVTQDLTVGPIFGQTLEIDAGTIMQFDQDVSFFWWDGVIVTAGDLEDDPVIFMPFEDASWGGIQSIGAMLGMELRNCIITGVESEERPALEVLWASEALIEGCQVKDNNSFGGVYLFSSEVDFFNNIIHDNTEFGVKIEDVDMADVWFFRNEIYNNGASDDPDEMNAGVILDNANPIFDTSAGEGGENRIHDNEVTGLYTLDSTPYLQHAYHSNVDVGNNSASIIAANGRNHLQGGAVGAEIYADVNSPLTIKKCDIFDEFEDNGLQRLGLLIFVADVADAVNAPLNFWSTIENHPAAGDFGGDGGPLVIFNNHLNGSSDAIFYWRSVGAPIDNVDPFIAAVSAFEAGNYNDAAERFRGYIAEYPDNNQSVQAIKFLKSIIKRNDGNYQDLREYCLDLASEQSETAAGTAAGWMAIDCLTADGNFRQARLEYEDIAQNAERDEDALIANLRLLHLEARENGYRVNSLASLAQRRKALLAEARQQRELDLQVNAQLPTTPSLTSTYPNPFNQSTIIQFYLPEAAQTNISIIDMQGRSVAMLVDDMHFAGDHSVVWNALGLPAGMYVVRLETGNGFQTSQKVMLLK